MRWIEDAGESAKDMDRPGMQAALALLSVRRPRREVSALVVAKLDRVSRSVGDFAGLMAQAKRQSWAVLALTSTWTRRHRAASSSPTC